MIMTSGYFNSTFCFYFALKWEVLNSLFPFSYQSSSIMSMLLRLTMLPYYSLWCFFFFLTLRWSARNWLLTFSWFHFQCYMDISTLKKRDTPYYHESKQISQILHKTKSQESQMVIKRKTHAYNSPLALISMGPCIIISLLL